MEFLTEKLNDKYDIEKATLQNKVVQITVTPKHTNCFGCSKRIHYKTANSLVWFDKDNCKRYEKFCNSCRAELQKYGYNAR
mgnify:FL=1